MRPPNLCHLSHIKSIILYIFAQQITLLMDNPRANIIGIARHRLSTDGDGVTTLVAFHGCPLNCLYCLNPQSLVKSNRFKEYSPKELYEETKIDELYFLATNGGITFGGGEPALYANFITEFRIICGPEWHLNLETSLNVPVENVKHLLPVIDSLIIDVKDMNREIYRQYTGKSNELVIENLRYIAREKREQDCIIRLPLIPDFNTDDDRMRSRNFLESLGFKRFDLFTYQKRTH